MFKFPEVLHYRQTWQHICNEITSKAGVPPAVQTLKVHLQTNQERFLLTLEGTKITNIHEATSDNK